MTPGTTSYDGRLAKALGIDLPPVNVNPGGDTVPTGKAKPGRSAKAKARGSAKAKAKGETLSHLT